MIPGKQITAMSQSTPPTVRQLRSRWKPVKQRLLERQSDHPTHVRFHRCCSWLQRVEQLKPDSDWDDKLICQWIALNALYGQWDTDRGEPRPDAETLDRFLDRVLELDADGVVAGVLTSERKLVEAILKDAYVTRYFWRDPSPKQAGKAGKAYFDSRTWYLEQRWPLLLDRLLERIYLVRCQLVHGAATRDSKLNRTCVRRCSQMLSHLLPAFLAVWTEHGADEDWGVMCYPPTS